MYEQKSPVERMRERWEGGKAKVDVVSPCYVTARQNKSSLHKYISQINWPRAMKYPVSRHATCYSRSDVRVSDVPHLLQVYYVHDAGGRERQRHVLASRIDLGT